VGADLFPAPVPAYQCLPPGALPLALLLEAAEKFPVLAAAVGVCGAPGHCTVDFAESALDAV
jgi:hypothetical protein